MKVKFGIAESPAGNCNRRDARSESMPKPMTNEVTIIRKKRRITLNDVESVQPATENSDLIRTIDFRLKQIAMLYDKNESTAIASKTLEFICTLERNLVENNGK